MAGGLKGVPLQMRPDQASGSSLPHVWPLVFGTKPADCGLIEEIRESESD